MTPSLAARFASAGFLAIGILAASPALAQTPARPPARAQNQVRVPKWEFEVHGTFATPSSAPSGPSKAPSQGPTFTLGDGSTPSQAVPSWFFGYGTAFLNQVVALRGLPDRLTALDSNGWPAAGRRPGIQAGARIAGRITDTVWFELTADWGLDRIGFDGKANAKIEETRSGFVRLFTALNNSTLTLMPNPTITSTATVLPGGGRLVTTGVVQYRGTGPGTRPYVLAGVGFATPIGRSTSLELAGRYQLTTPGGTTFDETDTLVLSYRAAAAFVTVAGFGFMRDVSPRSGFRVETRVMFGPSRVDVLLNTDPVIDVTTPTGAAILNSTNPGLQFATNGLRTNLSVPPIHDFAVLTATGHQIQWVVSAGYFRRF